MDEPLFTRAMKAAARALSALCVLGPLFALVYLPLSLGGSRIEHLLYDKGWLAALVLGGALLLRLVPRSRIGLALHRIVLGAPCFLAPISLLFPWAVVPGKLGLAVGGPAFFYGWLFKYPTLGPVNGEVLCGILCLLGAAALPWLFALLWVSGARLSWLIAVMILSLFAWVPVVVRLDLHLALASLAAGGAALWAGPLYRAAAIFFMGWILLRSLAHRP